MTSRFGNGKGDSFLISSGDLIVPGNSMPGKNLDNTEHEIAKIKKRIEKELKTIKSGVNIEVYKTKNKKLETLYILTANSIHYTEEIKTMVYKKLGKVRFSVYEGTKSLPLSPNLPKFKGKKDTIIIKRKAYLMLSRPLGISIFFQILLLLFIIFLMYLLYCLYV